MSVFADRDVLLDQMLDDGLITEDQATDVYDEHERTGKPVREVILDLEIVNEDDILLMTASQLGTEVVTLEGVEFTPQLVHSIPSSVARMYSVVPVDGDQHAVTLATSEMIGPEVMDELNFVLSRDITYVVAPTEEIRGVLEKHYGDSSESVSDMLTALEAEFAEQHDFYDDDITGERVIDLEEAANAAPVVRFVNLVLYQAIQDRASDIHFEPFETEFKIRYRVDGALYELAPPPRHMALPVTTRVKVISGLNIAERRLPQDGRIQISIGGKPIDLRVSCLPTQHGESVVLRVLDRSVVALDIENLGMGDDIYDTFCTDITKPNGILIVTGPTGSGKTTTLYSALRRINKLESKLLTAEDPVEYDVEGIIQLPVNDAIGVTFSRALRAFLRQDPDIIMVGEIRDLDTAQIAIQASLTGHLVFSTLHTNDSAGAVTRLVDMGVEPFLIASTLEGVLGQRLVRTVCKNCPAEFHADASMLKALDLTEGDVGGRPFYFGEGCQHCNNTGYRGRRGLYEYLRMSDELSRLVNERKPTVVLRNAAIKLGMRTIRQDGIRCIFDGYTTVEEVLRYT